MRDIDNSLKNINFVYKLSPLCNWSLKPFKDPTNPKKMNDGYIRHVLDIKKL